MSNINSFGGNNFQSSGKKTQVFNNHRQNINNLGNNNRQNDNNENKNNLKVQHFYRGNRDDNNNLNPETEIRFHRNNNILKDSININLFPYDDSKMNNILSNNISNNNNINVKIIGKHIQTKRVIIILTII